MENCIERGNCIVRGGKNLLRDEKDRLITVIVAVFLWGLAAHAYGLLNLTISHDSLCEFMESTSTFSLRIRNGRFMAPMYKYLFHGRVALPWLNGLLSLCWLSVAVWLTARMFSIADKLRLVLLAGVFTVNITVTALAATYIHEIDTYIFGAMLSTCAAFLWHQGGRKAWLAVPLLALVLGLYQSMLSVAIALIMFVSILALLRGEKAAKVVRKGLQAIAIILVAGAIYLLCVKLSCLLTGIELTKDGPRSLRNIIAPRENLWEIVWPLLVTYYCWLEVFTHSSRSMYEIISLHILLVIPVVIAIVHAMRQKSLPGINKALVLVLGALLPMGMNISCVLSGGTVHDLMLYAVWLTYLLAILLTDWYAASAGATKKMPRYCRVIALLALILILGTDVQTANSAYVKKDLESQATLSLVTIVNEDLNETEGYVAGETGVCLVGVPQTGLNDIFPYTSKITGLGYGSPISCASYYATRYYQFILQTPLAITAIDVPSDFTEAMPCYPNEGYIQWYGDALVVMLSNPEE